MMKTSIIQQWQQVQEQWRANARLRVLVIAVAVILVFAFLQQLQQLQQKAKQNAHQQYQRLRDVQQLNAEQHWQERAAISKEALAVLNKELWRAASEGQAQAQLRDALAQLLKKQGLTTSRFNVTAMPSDQIGLLQVRADILGTYEAGAWQEFMHELSRWQPKIIIEHDSVNRTNTKRNVFRISVQGWFLIKDDI